MLFATALLVASDMAYSEADVPSAIEPVWMLGQFLLLSALLVFPGATEAVPPQLTTRSSLEEVAARQRSGLSGVLILLSLGGVLLSVAIGLVSVHPIWKSFFSVLFVVALVVALVWLTDCFDEAVQYLKTYTTRLHQKRLQTEDWREADTRIRTTLQSTGLLANLGVTRSHSRPHVSDDNPYSEAQFKTLKYQPDFPARFDSIENARAFCQGSSPGTTMPIGTPASAT